MKQHWVNIREIETKVMSFRLYQFIIENEDQIKTNLIEFLLTKIKGD